MEFVYKTIFGQGEKDFPLISGNQQKELNKIGFDNPNKSKDFEEYLTDVLKKPVEVIQTKLNVFEEEFIIKL